MVRLGNAYRMDYVSSESFHDHNYRRSGSGNTRWQLSARHGEHDELMEEFELGDDCNCHNNSSLSFTGDPEFQQSETNEGTNVLSGHTG